MDKPEVDRIDGIPPAIAIEQKNNVRTTRSTVGTLTEINDYLKLLFARARHRLRSRHRREHPPRHARLRRRLVPSNTSPAEPVLVTFRVPVPARHQTRRALRLPPPARLPPRPPRRRNPPHRRTRRAAVPSAPVARSTSSRTASRSPRRNRSRLLEALEAAFDLGKGQRRHPSSRNPAPDRSAVPSRPAGPTPPPASPLRAPTPALFTFNNPLGACPNAAASAASSASTSTRPSPTRRSPSPRAPSSPSRASAATNASTTSIAAASERGIDLDTPWEDLADDEPRMDLRRRS